MAKVSKASILNLEEKMLNEKVVATDATTVTVNGKQHYIRNLSVADSVIYHAMSSKSTTHKYAKQEEKALLNRMEKYSHNHLLFLYDFAVPFDDNISERDLRKAKNRQKMAGGFRKESGNTMYCSIMTIIETLKKRKMGIIENIKMLFTGTPAIF